MPTADLALGQTSLFGQPIKDASGQTLTSAYGLALTAAGNLVVSDPLANRILYFQKTAGGDFQTGESASNVFGQADFNSSLATVLAGPHLIAVDASDQLYVADTGNNRIAALPSVPTAGNNPPVLFAIPQLSSPYGVFVNQATGEIWAANTGGNQVLRYASSAAIIINAAPSATLGVFGPVSIALDPFGNPMIAEGSTNRVSFYFPAIDYTTSAGGVPGQSSGNAANFFGSFAPGMLATIFSFPAAPFGAQDRVIFRRADIERPGRCRSHGRRNAGSIDAGLTGPDQLSGSRRDSGERPAGNPSGASFDWPGSGQLAVPNRRRVAGIVHRRWQRIGAGCRRERGWGHSTMAQIRPRPAAW